jgi:hypothetical protein
MSSNRKIRKGVFLWFPLLKSEPFFLSIHAIFTHTSLSAYLHTLQQDSLSLSKTRHLHHT